MPDTPQNPAVYYHTRTKHYPQRFAASAGYLDWENQPNPFRFYEGVQPLSLPLNVPDPPGAYSDLYSRERNGPRDFSPENISLFLALSLGLSAWKSAGGARWALRMNPSSGNLHPTEAYLMLPKNLGRAESGLYHYSPYLHALEPRTFFPPDLSQSLAASFSSGGFLLAFTSIFWREAWKYGERAFRYCQHDMGHAMAAVSFAGNLLGWKVSCLTEVSDADLSNMLGFPKTKWIPGEEEFPEVLCSVTPVQAPPVVLKPEWIRQCSELSFQGTPNRLSADHLEWSVIGETAEATLKPRTVSESWKDFPPALETEANVSLKAAQIIRQRRSLLACDGVTSISKAVFLTMLGKTLPREGRAPFDLKLAPARVNLFLMVHRVTDLVPGLYAFIRTPEKLSTLKASCRTGFLWKPVEEGSGLYLLQEKSLSSDAASVSCVQSIAGDGAFSLGMVAEFLDPVIREPFLYRRLFWETGMIGQVLYLEAEAHGVRSTGIGCFFDDGFHDMLGLKNQAFQSLYHFTVGGPVEDVRIQSDPPYNHLSGS